MTHRFYVLQTEIVSDPDTRGYSGMTNAQVASDINSRTVSGDDKASITGTELYELMDLAELSALQQRALGDVNSPSTPAVDVQDRLRLQRLELLLSLAVIDVSPGSKGRADLQAIFTNTESPNTRAALTAWVQQTQPKWKELGLPGPVLEGWVNDVRRANSLPGVEDQ